jgi:hypothetical protein
MPVVLTSNRTLLALFFVLALLTNGVALAKRIEVHTLVPSADWLETSDFNLLKSGPVRAALQRYRQVIPADQTRKSAHQILKIREVVTNIARFAGVTGGTVYYPFGGSDPITPFLFSDNISDVIIQTAEPAGSVKEIMNAAEQEYYLWATQANHSFDVTPESSEGRLPVSVARAINHLKFDVVGIFFTKISPQGNLQLIETCDSDPSEVFDHALVLFRDPLTGKIKRLWQFRHLIGGRFASGSFPLLIKRLHFDTMLIKAANDELFEARSIRAETFAISLDRAREVDAVVIADVRHTSPTETKLPTMDDKRPIWHKDGLVRVFDLPEGAHFGYSSNRGKGYFADAVFVGKGSDLVSTKTPFRYIPNLDLAYARHWCGAFILRAIGAI